MHLARVSALPGGPATHGINNPLAWIFMKPATRRLFSKIGHNQMQGQECPCSINTTRLREEK